MVKSLENQIADKSTKSSSKSSKSTKLEDKEQTKGIKPKETTVKKPKVTKPKAETKPKAPSKPKAAKKTEGVSAKTSSPAIKKDKPTGKRRTTTPRSAKKAPFRTVKEQLWNHNLDAFTKVMEKFEQTNKVMLVQPTGSGKSGVMFGVIEEVLKTFGRVLIVVPYLSIETNHKAESLWQEEWSDRVSYVTYSSLGVLSKDTDKEFSARNLTNIDLIVLDEVHHLNAPIWTQGYDRLLAANPSVRVLGMTATPVRHLDGGLDVGEVYFNGVVVEELDLPKAIKTGVFKRPICINGVYNTNKILANLHQLMDTIPDEDKRLEVESAYNAFTSVWSEKDVSQHIIQKYINEYHSSRSNLKFIVFFSSIQDLYDCADMVKYWFSNLGKKVRVLKLHSAHDDFKSSGSKHPKDEAVLKSFSRASKDQVDLLFCVNKVNEGVHLDTLTGVVMLRNTTSANLCVQQIGRIFSGKMIENPLIFDFVNNFSQLGLVENLLTHEGDEKEEKQSIIANERIPLTVYPTFDLFNESMGFFKLLDTLTGKTTSYTKRNPVWVREDEESWAYCFNHLVEHISVFDELPTTLTNERLQLWLNYTVTQALTGKLSPDRVERLKGLGIRFS